MTEEAPWSPAVGNCPMKQVTERMRSRLEWGWAVLGFIFVCLVSIPFLFFLESGSYYVSPDWPRMCSVDLVGSELTEIYLPLPSECCG